MCELRMPTLIVWGRDDRIYDIAGAEKLHRRFPGSEARKLLMEDAGEAAPLYLDFLARAHPEKKTAQPRRAAP